MPQEVDVRQRARVLIFVSLLAWAGCIDTAEPTGPVPAPNPDDGGELAPGAVVGEETSESKTSAVSPRRPAS
jgi:hypothetical protein